MITDSADVGLPDQRPAAADHPMLDSTGPIEALLTEVWLEAGQLDGGELATYIPQLAHADPRAFGIALATLDGRVYSAGELVPFTIQSVSKPFVYALALAAYFRQCSVLVTAKDLAVMAATLANGGVNPLTGVQVVPPAVVSRVLTVMSTCGMYDFAGEWLYRVGLPAKSGVSGGIAAVQPGRLGFGAHSPLLDGRGNSVRGIAAYEMLSQRLDMHLFAPNGGDHDRLRPPARGDAVCARCPTPCRNKKGRRRLPTTLHKLPRLDSNQKPAG